MSKANSIFVKQKGSQGNIWLTNQPNARMIDRSVQISMHLFCKGI